MSNSDELLISMSPAGRHVVGKVGDIEVEEEEFTLQLVAVREKANLIQVRHQNLLPKTTSDYISIKQAEKESGISSKKLRDLIDNGDIEGIKVKNTWLLLRESLRRYVHENRNSS